MKYCSKCIMPATRPGLKLNKEGVCSACLWQDTKQTINWEERKLEFIEIANWAKQTTKSAWDCVLGVSGGKDSTWQAMQLRDEFGLNPLLVQYVSSDGNEIGRYNMENLTKLGFSVLSVQPSPRVARILSKESFFRYGNLHKYAEMVLFPVPFRYAMLYEIPLVFFGENPALEAGDCNSGEGWDATTIINNNTLGGHSYKIWLSDEIQENDLIQYKFPSKEEFNQWGGKGIFMGYYLNWSGWNNAVFAIKNGMKVNSADYAEIGGHYKHNSLDSDFGGIVNAMLKHVKLGFGNTTEHACYDIRNERITREEAALLAKELDGRCHPRYIRLYCDWIGIDEKTFWQVADKFRGNMWKKDSSNNWILDYPIWEQLNIPKHYNVKDIIHTLIKKMENAKHYV